MPTLLMMSALRFSLLATVLLAACTIKQSSDADSGQGAECLELFETCVELAGESPGCTEVFQFCEGSVDPAGTGGGPSPDGCERDYIDCLAGGATADDCQPLLDACQPSGSTTGCDPGEPTCGMLGDADTSDGTGGGEMGCPPDEPECSGSECEARYEDCINTLDGGDVCEAIRGACLDGDCETALAICGEYTRDSGTCSELTGCRLDPPQKLGCDELLAQCEDKGVAASECGNLHPDRPECFPEPEGCQWYEDECYAQFDVPFCDEALPACEVGVLPGVFDCGFIELACDPAGLTDPACGEAQLNCETGFFDINNCTQTPLAKDPFLWLNELATCNGWM